MHISEEGVRLIAKWEEFVPYIYDDKVPKRRIDGQLQYPEWEGARLRGTLTIGYGHTNAAGPPHLTYGLHVTKEEAEKILADDLAPCERDVARLVKVKLSQHQFDALVSFTFNCGAGNLKKLVARLNQGDYDDVPRRMMNYVTSKGERMRGLVNRRTAEVKLWNTPDDPEEAEINEEFSSKAEENKKRSAVDSKSIATAATAGTSAIAAAANAIKEHTEPVADAARSVKEIHDTVNDSGLIEHIWSALHNPVVLCTIVALCAAFLVWDRYRKLKQDHV
jgi:GH24 family phage-related lysozyme (muramidase)